MNFKSILQNVLDGLYWLLLFFSVPAGLGRLGSEILGTSSGAWAFAFVGSVFVAYRWFKRNEANAARLSDATRKNLVLFEEEQKNGVSPSDGLNHASFDFLRRMDSAIDEVFMQKK